MCRITTSFTVFPCWSGIAIMFSQRVPTGTDSLYMLEETIQWRLPTLDLSQLSQELVAEVCIRIDLSWLTGVGGMQVHISSRPPSALAAIDFFVRGQLFYQHLYAPVGGIRRSPHSVIVSWLPLLSSCRLHFELAFPQHSDLTDLSGWKVWLHPGLVSVY